MRRLFHFPRLAARAHLVLLVILILFSAAPAAANGRFPASSSVIFDPHDSKTIYARTTFGLVASRDGGSTWRWICERAIGFSGTEDPTYVVTPKGTLVGGTFSGVALSRDGGCNFAFSQGQGTHILSDLTLRPGGEIVGMSSVSSKTVGMFDNHIVVSKDDAQTFGVTGGPIDPTLLLETVETAPSEPTRIYVSAVRGEGEKRTASLLVSLDGGMSWAERKIELSSGETAPFIAAVDPKNADRVYVRTAGGADARSRLLVTDDAGRTWKKVFEASSPISGFAMSEDGARVIVGARDGLSSSPTNAFSFTKGSVAEIQCLAMNGAVLWACSSERSGFVLGTSRNAGKNFDPRLHLDEIKGPLECPAESGVAKHCTADWDKLRRDLGIPDANEKPRTMDTGGPALHGRSERPRGTRSTFAAMAAAAAFLYVVYEVLRRIRRR